MKKRKILGAVLAPILATAVNAQEVNHKKMLKYAYQACRTEVEESWFQKRYIEIGTYKQKGTEYLLIGRCYEPICSPPYKTWYIYEVSNSKFSDPKQITCTIEDGEDPVLDEYPEQSLSLPTGD
jgi:hypothetical protein